MRILVTGHKGYIGSHLYSSLKEIGHMSDRHQVFGIDLKDGRDILHHLPNERFDYVFHLAAFPRVEQSVSEPSDTFRNNAYATSVLLEWAKNHDVQRFIFSSSAAVYGNGQGPTSPYGLHKQISEQECRLYSNLYGLDTVCLRYFNVYSENQPYGGSYSTAISAWMQMIREKKPLRLDGDGEQTRDFVHVGDIVSANIFCMDRYDRFDGTIFDVGSGESCSLNYIKKIISEYHEVEWVNKPERIGDVKHTKSNIEPLRKLGWNPKISINRGLHSCFRRLR